MSSSVNGIYIRRIITSAAGGDNVSQAIIKAAAVVVEYNCTVEIEHNDRYFVITPDDVKIFINQFTPRQKVT